MIKSRAEMASSPSIRRAEMSQTKGPLQKAIMIDEAELGFVLFGVHFRSTSLIYGAVRLDLQ